MGKYEDYITRMCMTGRHTPEEAMEFAISREASKYYKNEKENEELGGSTYTPIGECV